MAFAASNNNIYIYDISQGEVATSIDLSREMKAIKHRNKESKNKQGDMESNVGSGALISSLQFSLDSN